MIREAGFEHTTQNKSFEDRFERAIANGSWYQQHHTVADSGTQVIGQDAPEDNASSTGLEYVRGCPQPC